ncbi:cysteine desulfurase-like protein [Kovacikia minuta CCNUW1]|uniref:cysteine desulfurase-like protein n=1 Tax=Kovacikia minuta TaxID=2931930 RepID=UPI001CCC1B4D|nr:cysteine desulfurase-like protein [Kovacikia minuta]UBF26186.1 cysteine desulfurase-like protein [Kovacikia minuta CCNUW1]
MESLDLGWIRAQFPALSQMMHGHPVMFLDGPGGTQTPGTVIEAIAHYLTSLNANLHGAFTTSIQTEAVIAEARAAMGDFLGCDPDEVVFGANMTTLTFALSRAIGRELQPGDEIVVTRLDHDANITPWQVLEERGVGVRMVDIHPEDCTLDWVDLERQITERTRVVAVGYASNAVGTINDVAKVVRLAHAVGALAFVDAVHYAPHGPINVRSLDCDFLACSAYKFFGPHTGILYGKREHLTRLRPYKLKPAPEEIPFRWETGTQNHESLAGVVAMVNYLAELGRRISPAVANRRNALFTAMAVIQQEERHLSEQLIPSLLQIPGLNLYGIREPSRFAWRTPTVAIRLDGYTPYELAKALGDRGIFTWNGNFYAIHLTEKLGVEASGGFLRIGFVHYNTIEEAHRLLNALHDLAVRQVAV